MRRMPGDVADDLDARRVDVALERDRPPFLVVQDRLEREVALERLREPACTSRTAAPICASA